MAKLTIATALFIGPSLLLAQPRPIPTWNGLAFGMTLDEAKAALTDRNLKVVDNGDSLDVSGDMGAADGSAKLSFSLPQHRLEKIVLTFDYGLKDYGYSTNPGAADAHCRVDISMVSRDEAIRRAAFAGKVARKYLERYGKPIFATGD